MKDKRGFTLIELIVILGLATIVMTAVMSFFIANYRNYNRINTESELQYQSQYIINFMTDKILEAQKYKGKTSSGYVFEHVDDYEMTFKYDDGSESLKFEEDGRPETTIGESVSEFEIKTNPEGLDPVDAKEVLITMKLLKNKIEVYAEQTVYMRNSE